MSMKSLTLLASATAFTVATATFADGHLTQEQQGAIDARQSHMGLYGFNLGPLVAMAQERIPYDAAVASAAAANLAALGSVDQTRYWVEGTDSSIEGSRAKSEIWTDMAGYMAEEEKFRTTTATLASVAGDGLDAMRAAFGPVGQSCGSCHESYRVPRN